MITTAHINSKKSDFAETVIMPGDPLRSKFIAETFLDNPVLINNVRGVQGYTGFYNGKKVTVMASGMGNPSMGIYSYELFKFCDVKKIIRVGTIGAMREDVKIKDLIIAQRAYTNTNFNNFFKNNGEGFVSGDDQLINEASNIAKNLNLRYHVGDILNSDTFYTDEDEIKKSKENNLLGVEMESASLYINAKRLNKQALVICTVSNNLITGEETSSEERQNAFKEMIKVALEMA